MKRKQQLKLSEVITYITNMYITKGEKEVYLDYGWCVYSMENNMTLESICYIDDYPEFDEEDNEIYSPFIVQNNMKLIYRDEMIQDVVIACLNQKRDATLDEIMRSLIYYEEYDSFLELQ